MFTDLWNYRQFIRSSIRNEMLSRFARSKIGGFWMLINPLSQVAIYSLILSNVLAAKLPGIENKYAYAIYLLSGLLAWTLFNDIVIRCLNLFTEQSNLIKKNRFPKIALPIIAAGSNIVSNILLLFSILVILFFLQHDFSLEMLWLFPFMLILAGFSIGLGLVLGVINVFIRDLTQAVPIILQILFWFTPIVYPETIIPAEYVHWLKFNPMYHFVSSYHDILMYGKRPQELSFLISVLLALLFLLFSLFLFRRAKEDIVDEL